MAEDSLLNSLIEREIPDGMQALQDSHRNLAGLAAYCKESYRQVGDKSKVLTETKQYAAQSLASVAYQVHSLAVNMLQMMDQQMIQLTQMGADVGSVSLTVDIHKEKVARREIGALTASKNVTRGHKIVAPPQQQEKPRRYKREEIDYTVLDHIGHGVSTGSKRNDRRHSQSSTGSGHMKGSLSGTDSLRSSSTSINSNERSIKAQTPLPPPVQPPVPPTKIPHAPIAPQLHKPPPPPTAPGPQPPPYGGNPAPPPPPPMNIPAPPPSSYGAPAPPPPLPPPQMGIPTPPPPPPMGALEHQLPPPMGAPAPPPPPPMGAPAPPPPPPMGAPAPPPPPPMAAPMPPSLPSPPDEFTYEHISAMPPPPPTMDMPVPPPPPPNFMPPPSAAPPAKMPPPPASMMKGGYDGQDFPLPPGDPNDVYDVPPVRVAEQNAEGLPVLYKVQALHEYQKNWVDELEFEEKEVIEVFREHDDGWLEGRTADGRSGLLPGNYVIRM